jgi:hypothetical protein
MSVMGRDPASARSRIGWILLSVGLTGLWISAWGWPSWHHGLASWFQRWYGVDFMTAPWYLRGNAPLHVVSAALLAWWGMLGVRCWRPQWSPWWGLVPAVVIAVGDEAAQALTTFRGFNINDWPSDALGMVLAAVAWWLGSRRRPAAPTVSTPSAAPTKTPQPLPKPIHREP